jgi:REP element-mobilizing transposase RayT
MGDRYKNKYRIPSARARYWDYSWNAAYFVTICTYKKEYYFGTAIERAECADNDKKVPQIRLNELGRIADDCWQKIPSYFPFVLLDTHVIMPNHIHGIVIINNLTDRRSKNQGHSIDNSLPKNKFGPQSGNLGAIIRGFKSGVTQKARQLDSSFRWQSRYHDHIIRNNETYRQIKKYIQNNPATWQQDTFFDG